MLLPFMLYLKNSALFQSDLYIQSAAATFPNERLFIILLISIVPLKFTYLWTLFLHIFFSILLFTGLRKIASLYINNEWLQWLAVAANLVILYLYAPGGNELYYNTLIASLAAKGIAVWAVYCFLTKRLFAGVLLLIPSTWLHALVGLHLAAIFFLVYLLQNFAQIKNHIGILAKSFVWYVLFAVSFVLFIKYKSDTIQLHSHFSDADFYETLFNFRNPHHYNPLQFSIKSYLLFTILLPISIYVFRKNKSPLYFIIIGILLFCIASINALFVKNISIASLQFFKVAIWLKFFGVVAIITLLNKQSEKFFAGKLSSKINQALILFLLLAISAFYFSSEKFNLHFDMPSHVVNNAETDISLKAKDVSETNNIFIYPIHFTKFPFYSQRNSYINFKAIVREKNYMKEWSERISEIYNITAKNKLSGFDIKQTANDNFFKINLEQAQSLKEKGITHIITFKSHKIKNLKVIAENSEYKIYKL
jgi:hypothetical protein